jgi:hypothetical protein
MRLSAGGTLAVTYANDKLMDGAGAQLQRIYGVFAISRLLQVPYVHTPLLHVGYQGLAALEANSADPELVPRYNRMFAIASDIRLAESCATRDLREVDFAALSRLGGSRRRNDAAVLARITLPYGITDRYPDAYRCVNALSPFAAPSASSVIRVAVHVRRGELFVVDSDRMLPNRYYIAAMQNVAGVLRQRGLEHRFEVHSEVPQKAFTVTPTHHAIEERISAPVTIDPRASRLDEFEVVDNVDFALNADPIEALERMATADVLITSHSSFSYVASLLNRHGVIVHHPFWHSPLSDWIVTDDSGEFSESRFFRQLRRGVKTRGLA